MKTYLFLGSKDLIDYYFTQDLLKQKNKVIIVDYIEEKHYTFDPSFKGNIKTEIKESKYQYYNLKLDSKDFKDLLKKIKPDYIIYGLTSTFQNFDLIEFVNNIKETSYSYKMNFIMLSSIQIYENVKKTKITEHEIILPTSEYAIFTRALELLLKDKDIKHTILRCGHFLGYNIPNSIIQKRIRAIYSDTLIMPFPTLSKQDLFIPSFIHLKDIKDTLFKIINFLDNNEILPSIINLTNSSLDLEEIDKIILKETNLIDYYNKNDLDSYYYSFPKLRTIDISTLKYELKIASKISLNDGIKDTLEWYNKTYLVNKKLDAQLKEKIDNTKQDDLRKLYNKYYQHKLTNQEIIKYINQKLS